MIKAIIFGSNGQDGYYLNKFLLKKNVLVTNVSRNNSDFNGDIGNLDFVENLIKIIQPDYIFHFAAISSTSHEYLYDNHNAISIGTINILNSVNKFSKKTRVFISGSALQFKNNGSKINEQSEFDYTSCYAVERIYSVHLSRYFREKFNLKIYIGYLFNHDSILRSNKHINKKISNAVLNFHKGINDKILIGDLNIIKEFNFAGDIVEAIWILVNQNKIFEAVIGSGLGYSIRNWIEECFNYIGIKFVEEKHVLIDSSFKPTYNSLVSDPTKIVSIGWKPNVNFKQMVKLMMDNKLHLLFFIILF
jgi:GDPmannose 4,6-dehydratase